MRTISEAAAVLVALGVSRDWVREVLGLWIVENEGAKFWLSVMTELKNWGVYDILIAVVDGLKGFPEAIAAAFPEATSRTFIVHLVRHSLSSCSGKVRKAVAADLRENYSARQRIRRPWCSMPLRESGQRQSDAPDAARLRLLDLVEAPCGLPEALTVAPRLGLAPGRVDLLIKMLAAAALEIGDDVAGVPARGTNFYAGDDAAGRPRPGRVGEGFEPAQLLTRGAGVARWRNWRR
ncbi:Transposase, Mutator family [Palleronia marisminoris]|nr:Transposase, Mutator family [Palleronia marisminoris]